MTSDKNTNTQPHGREDFLPDSSGQEHHHTGPFITAISDPAGRNWHTSRRFRKGLAALYLDPEHTLSHQVYRHALEEASRLHLFPKELTRAQWLGYSIAIAFTIGAFLFAFASGVFLWVPSQAMMGFSVNQIYASGSVFFTTAGFLQLLEAINGDITKPTQRFKWWGFSPKNLGYLSCLAQFGGTIMFNFNTFDALNSQLTVAEQNAFIWGPNMIGSILFLVSSYFGWLEQNHKFWAFNVLSWSGWIVAINALGAVFFQISAFLAFYSTPALPGWATDVSVFCTLSGAVCFLLAALMLLPEYASD